MGHDNPPIRPPFPIPPQNTLFRPPLGHNNFTLTTIDGEKIPYPPDEWLFMLPAYRSISRLVPQSMWAEKEPLKTIIAGAAVMGWMEERHIAGDGIIKARALRKNLEHQQGSEERRLELHGEIHALWKTIDLAQKNVELCFKWGRAHE